MSPSQCYNDGGSAVTGAVASTSKNTSSVVSLSASSSSANFKAAQLNVNVSGNSNVNSNANVNGSQSNTLSSTSRPTPRYSANTNTNINTTSNNNSNNNINNSSGINSNNSNNLSPSTAALSTAAAVAAMSACFTASNSANATAVANVNVNVNPTASMSTGMSNNNNSNCNNTSNTQNTNTAAAAAVAAASATLSSSTVNANTSMNASTSSNMNANANTPAMLSVPMLPGLPASMSVPVRVQLAQSQQQQQQQQGSASMSNSTSTSTIGSNVPCHAPGPIGILSTSTQLQQQLTLQHTQQQQQQQQRRQSSTSIYKQTHNQPTSTIATTTTAQTASTATNNATTTTTSNTNNGPGPLAPPPSRLLPLHQHPQMSTASIMLPQNQLIYGYNHSPLPASSSAQNQNQPQSQSQPQQQMQTQAQSLNKNQAVGMDLNVNANLNNININTNVIRHLPQQQQQQQQQVILQQQHHHHQLRHPGATPTTATFHHHPLNTNATIQATRTNASSFRPRAMQISSPNIFANMALRRGKWTSEEERFANALIEEFEKGTILDCENGCTLRAYLSRKLHCAPMRISKKYAGKSIGKHVFLSRIPALLNRNGVNVNVGLGGLASATAGGNVNGNMNIRSTNENLDKIRDLQFHFHMSLLQEGAACALGQNIGKSLTSGATSTSARVGGLNVNVAAAVNCVQGGHMHASVLPRTAAGVPACAPSNGAGFPLIFPTPHSNFNATANAQSPTSFMNTTSKNASSAAPSTTYPWFTQGQTAPPATAAPSTANFNDQGPATAIQMQETLFNAFKEAHTSSTVPNATTIGKPNDNIAQSACNNNIIFQYTKFNEQVDSDGSKSKISTGGIPELFSYYQNANNDPVATGEKESNKAPDDIGTNQSREQNNTISTSQAQQNWLSETMHIIPTLDPSSYMGQFSPTYTSQSFDDLHQFIGKDCPPSTKTSITLPNNVTEIKGPATEAANNLHQQNFSLSNGIVSEADKFNSHISAADTYALFAQQSAMAVSKHSAYAPVDSNNNSRISSQITPATVVLNEPISSLASSQPVLNVAPTKQLDDSLSIQRVHITAPSPVRPISKNIVPSNKVTGVKIEDVNTSSVTFNAANLQLHSAAVEERERADNAFNDDENSESASNLSRESVQTPAQPCPSKFNSSSVLRHANVVSGSDRSSESMSAGGSGSSGSDNASDNSDETSDEGQSSSNAANNSKRRNVAHQENKKKKRQKTSAAVKKETIQ